MEKNAWKVLWQATQMVDKVISYMENKIQVRGKTICVLWLMMVAIRMDL